MYSAPLLPFSSCQSHRARHPAGLTKNSQWRIGRYTVPFAFGVSFFVLAFGCSCFDITINWKGIDNEFYARGNRSSKPADSVLVHGWKWIRLERAVFFFFALTFPSSTRGFPPLFLRGVKYRPLALVVNWLPTNCLLGSMLGESGLFDAVCGFQADT